MKSIFFASAAVAALIAAPAFAQDTAGSVSATYKYSDVEFTYDGANKNDIVLDGVVATPIFGDWTVTAAADVTYTDGKYYASETNLAGSVALTKEIGSYRVGGYYAATELYMNTVNTFGAVAQKYYDKATITGNLAYSTVYGIDNWALKANGTYYVTPQLAVTGGLGVNTTDLHGYSLETYSANIGAEYQLAASPYSVFASYTYSDMDQEEVQTEQLNIGLRYNFGGNKQSRDRAGAGLGQLSGSEMLTFFN